MKSYVVKASIDCPSLETVVDAENEIEAQVKAIALFGQKLARQKQFVSVEVKSKYVPAPDKGDYLLGS